MVKTKLHQKKISYSSFSTCEIFYEVFLFFHSLNIAVQLKTAYCISFENNLKPSDVSRSFGGKNSLERAKKYFISWEVLRENASLSNVIVPLKFFLKWGKFYWSLTHVIANLFNFFSLSYERNKLFGFIPIRTITNRCTLFLFTKSKEEAEKLF